MLPMLPFDRSGGARASGQHAEEDRETANTGATARSTASCAPAAAARVHACPPGAEASKVTWVGTCQNPKDNKDYLISYNDCCGKSSCGRCLCNYNLRERPGYRMGVHNDINWCMANKAPCTTARSRPSSGLAKAAASALSVVRFCFCPSRCQRRRKGCSR